MASSFQGIFENAGVMSQTAAAQKTEYLQIYQQHCHRIFSLAFYMTDSEVLAQELAANTFLRAFAGAVRPGPEQIDQSFLTEVREMMPVGVLSLNCKANPELQRICGRMKRHLLERAVVELPPTERLIFLWHDVDGYSHAKISHLLGLSEQESRFGLHQARLQVRERVSRMS
jgi:RNA polymerase sigma-70 factor, ECF subfamily